MLNKLWPFFLITAFMYGILTGNVDKVNKSIFESTANAVELSITFLGTICLWNGIMQIARKTTLIEKLTKFIKPIINFLFPEMKNNEKAKEDISMNIIANVLGLGNAATPLRNKSYENNAKRE